ncbi:restriction endonuclease subunit S [Methylobacterium sp. Leaf469]|uniref:restriction endonuclease subunit S n=1 Tax=Methylobacterium sp. Leaf469 TaxID=1736387 RepID=UPI0009E74843|nr:restriction endonuclease subunit S [Methylobacterium sp. Leaf469]
MTTVSDLFDVRYGHSLELNRLIIAHRESGIAFVSRKMGGNGISAYVLPVPGVLPAPAGELTCALGGNGVLSTFIQEQPFYTGRDVARLIPRVPLSKKQLLFYCYCIKSNRYRYSYGRQANRTLKDIVVPAIADIPIYIEAADENAFDNRSESLSNKTTPNLNIFSWKKMQVQDLFDLRKGKRITKSNMNPGVTPFISALDNNNGLRQYIQGTPLHPGGLITVNYNGNGVAEAFFQPHSFIASDDVNVLYPRFEGLSALSALFLCAVIRLEKYRFNYGRKWNLDRMKESIIRVPLNAGGLPDIRFMEQYMSTLPYSSNVEHTSAFIQEAANV